MVTMDASVVVLTKNAGEGFATLLRCLFSQKFDGLYEVIIVDSGSLDDTLEIAQHFPVKTFKIAPTEFHHGRTRNLGAELSSGKTVAFVVQDALPLSSHWLQRLVENFTAPNVAMVIGRQIPRPTTKPPERFFYVYSFPEHRITITPGASDCHRDCNFISNVNSAVRRDVWQQFQFSGNIITAEDKEFAKRILLAGWTILYEPEAAVYHSHDLSLWTAFRKSLDYGISLRQGASGLPRSHKSLIRRVFDYSSAEVRYLHATGCSRWLPYSLIYEMAKHSGLLLGKAAPVRGNARSLQ